MKRNLCVMLLLVALLLIGISSLFASSPPQVKAGDGAALSSTITVELSDGANGGGYLTILENSLFMIGRIT